MTPLGLIVFDSAPTRVLTVRADRKRSIGIFAIIAAVLGVAIGGYLAGKNAAPSPCAGER